MSRWVQSAHRPVCRRAAQRGPRSPADVGGADEHDLGLVLLNHVTDDLGVAVSGVVLQHGVVADVHAVSAVAAQLLGDALDAVAQQDAVQLGAQLVGQLAALRISSKEVGIMLPWRCSQNTQTPPLKAARRNY